MRRPAAFLCCAYILGIATENLIALSKTTLILLLILSIVIVTIFLCVNFKYDFLKYDYGLISCKQLSLFFIAILVGLIGSIQYNYDENKVRDLDSFIDDYVEIEANVTSSIKKDEKIYKLEAKAYKINGKDLTKSGLLNKSEKILVTVYGECDNYYNLQGKSVKIRGVLERPDVRRNPKTFDYRQYLKSKGIFSVIYTDVNNIKVGDTHSKLLNFTAKNTFLFKQNIYNYFNNEIAGLVMGMLFGDKTGIEEKQYEEFQKNGICHILAVSGLHIGALYITINSLTKRKRNIFLNIITVMVLTVYAVFANLSPSVVRAVIMIILHIVSKYFHCRYDLFTAGAITMAIMTLANPFIILSLGFQLSFIAIFTLAIILPTMVRLITSKYITIVAVQIGMAPISALYFNYFSLSAFITNIPVIFIAGILIPLEMLMLSLLMVNEYVSLINIDILIQAFDLAFQIIGIIVEFFIKVILFINDLFFYEKISYFTVISPSVKSILIYYALMFLICTEAFRIMWQRKHYKKIGLIIIVTICMGTLFGELSKDGFEEANFIFLDVGQGDCLLISTKDGKNVLIDSGGSYNFDVGKKILVPYMLKNGVKKIDLAIITHLHQDHVGGLSTLSKELNVEKLGVYESNCVNSDEVVRKTGINKEKIVYLAAGQTLQIGKQLNIEILYPNKKSMDEYRLMQSQNEDENLSCLVMKINLDNVSAIMTGDIDMKGEGEVIQGQKEFYRSDELYSKRIKANILKVAHHGSKYSSAQLFLSAVKPNIAIVQSGKNNYGHPHEEALQRIKGSGSIVYRNDLQGAVGIEVKKAGKVKIHTMI